MIFLDGTDVEGEFEEGSFKSLKIEIFSDRAAYVQEFKNIQICRGKIIYPHEFVYEGEFRDLIPNGLGKMTLVNGTVLEGQFKDGKLNHHGKMTLNGKVSVGQFKNGTLCGPGKVLFWSEGIKKIVEKVFLDGLKMES